ncbi:MAG: hypothetical protein ABI895_00450 [Deltaproteobacteria bacterium]
MKPATLRRCSILLLPLLSACGDGAPVVADESTRAPNAPGQGSSTLGSACDAARDAQGNVPITAAEANSYTFSSTLSFPPVSVAPGRELSFDWSDLSSDFLGHELDPLASIDTVSLMLWRLTEENLQTKLNADQLVQRDLAVIATAPTEKARTRLSLFDFGTPGRTPADPPLEPDELLPFVDAEAYDPAQNTYTLMVSTGTLLGTGTRMIQSFKLDPATNNVEVRMTDSSTRLDYSVDLSSLQQTPVPLGEPALTIDWSSMTSNALGNAFAPNRIGLVAVARYSERPADLENDFLDLIRYDRSVVADQVWLLDVPAGERAALSSAVDAEGGAFPGIEGSGTWMLALFCTQCQNPAPWYLTFLTGCPG